MSELQELKEKVASLEKQLEEAKKNGDMWYKLYNKMKARLDAVRDTMKAAVTLTESE